MWDRFLTEQDKIYLSLSKTRRASGFGVKPALLMIDLYRSAFGDQPLPLLDGVKKWPSYCGMAAWNSIPHLQKLLAAARRAYIPIIYTTNLYEPTIATWGRHSAAARSDRSTLTREQIEYGNQIMPEIQPIDGETVLRKSSPSVFWTTPLVGQLIHLGVDTILVAGESTSGCVRASVVDGCTNHFHMIVVEECVFDRHEAPHAMNLFDMNEKYADVIQLNDATKYLQNLSGHQ